MDEERERLLAGSAALALAALGRADTDGAGSAADPFAPIHGLYRLVANLAERQPILLLIDDLHWADSQTLRWIDYLARRLADLAVLVVAGVRTGESNVLPERLFVSRKTVEKHLGNVYTKLEISGREELAEALEQPGVE